MYFPTMETDRLILRALTPDDVEFVFRHFSDPDVCRYLYDAEPFADRQEAADLIRRYRNLDTDDHCRWALVLKGTGEAIGTCGFHFWDRENNCAEIGYDLRTASWGSGYMAEALRAALGNGFEVTGLNRVQAFISTDNARSLAAVERLGFTREGVIRDKHLFRGRYYDHACYSLLRREWRR
jgi:[ribosomal protein S5]-alanine N-acetyltransferase